MNSLFYSVQFWNGFQFATKTILNHLCLALDVSLVNQDGEWCSLPFLKFHSFVTYFAFAKNYQRNTAERFPCNSRNLTMVYLPVAAWYLGYYGGIWSSTFIELLLFCTLLLRCTEMQLERTTSAGHLYMHSHHKNR